MAEKPDQKMIESNREGLKVKIPVKKDNTDASSDEEDIKIYSDDESNEPDTPPGIEGGPGHVKVPPFLHNFPPRPLSAGSMTAPIPLVSESIAQAQVANAATAGPARQQFSKRQRTCSTSAAISTEREPVIRTSKRTIYTAGRPPWYDNQGVRMETFVIGICGGSASGKTTVAQNIIEELGVPWVTLLSMDSFYRVLTEEEHEKAARNEHNFDHPDAFDFGLLIRTLKRLKEGLKVEVPIYNFVTHRREAKTVSLYGANVVIFEGILAFHNKEVLEMLDMKVFVDTDSDIRLSRRLNRDITQRGRDMKSVLEQYERHVKPAFDTFIAPTMVHADIIVPRGGENEVAINLIVNHVQTQMDQRGLKLREKQANHNPGKGQPLPSSLRTLPSTHETEDLLALIRNRDIPREQFMKCSEELIRKVVSFALTAFPSDGEQLSKDPSLTCGVSILRAGEAFESALKDLIPDIAVGKIQIETSRETGEPELYRLELPKDIKDKRVILMDATVATGAAAMMAIRVLLDHEVPEKNIILVSLLMAAPGVHTIAYAFSKVALVTTVVDPEISNKFHVLPGIGNFGDRYFGTKKDEESS